MDFTKNSEQLGLLYAVLRDAASANARSDFDTSAEHLQVALDAVSAMMQSDDGRADSILQHVQRSGLDQVATFTRLPSIQQGNAERLDQLKMVGIDFSRHFLSLSVFRRSA